MNYLLQKSSEKKYCEGLKDKKLEDTEKKIGDH